MDKSITTTSEDKIIKNGIVPALVATLLFNKHKAMRCAAARVLGEICSEDAVLGLVDAMLNDSDWSVRIVAKSALKNYEKHKLLSETEINIIHWSEKETSQEILFSVKKETFWSRWGGFVSTLVTGIVAIIVALLSFFRK